MKCQDPKNRSPSRRVFAIISRILPEVEGGILWSGYVGSIGQDGGVRNEAGGGGQYQVNSSRNGYNSSRYLPGTGIVDELETVQISMRWGTDRYIIRLRVRPK